MNLTIVQYVLSIIPILVFEAPMKADKKNRPDKLKVIDEVWNDERIQGFLGAEVPVLAGNPLEGDHDFYVLLRAYRSMRIQDFEKFLDVFTQNEGNCDAVNGDGQTLEEVLSTHAKPFPTSKFWRNMVLQ